MNKLYEREAVQASYAFSDADLRAFFAQQQYDVEVNSQHIVCATEEEARLVLELLGEGVPFESLIRPYSLPNIQQALWPRRLGRLVQDRRGVRGAEGAAQHHARRQRVSRPRGRR